MTIVKLFDVSQSVSQSVSFLFALRSVPVIMTLMIKLVSLSDTTTGVSPVDLLPFRLVSVTAPKLHVDLHFNTELIRRTSGRRPGTFEQSNAVCDIRDDQT
jgi:hypothetical protein